ncbi:MAG: hypothetical protein HY895_12545 [Deltaproteobacteria bacterium]|nr:hypothetical protein [Deltaproteobacteria bacterium]
MDDGFANASGAAGHESALSGEFGFAGAFHPRISTQTAFGRQTTQIAIFNSESFTLVWGESCIFGSSTN